LGLQSPTHADTVLEADADAAAVDDNTVADDVTDDGLDSGCRQTRSTAC